MPTSFTSLHFNTIYLESEFGASRAHLHAQPAGQPEVDVVVRQQHVRQPLPVLRLVPLQPQQLGGCAGGGSGRGCTVVTAFTRVITFAFAFDLILMFDILTFRIPCLTHKSMFIRTAGGLLECCC